MMVIKLEKNRKVIKSWEFDKADDKLEKSILESLDADYDLIRKLRRERGTAEVEV
jgi:hypothetical protein